MPKNRYIRKKVRKAGDEVKWMSTITKSIKQTLDANFSTGCIPLLTISSKYLNTIIPTTNQIILNGLSYEVSSTQKVSNISFNSKPSFVGGNVHSFLENKNVHLSSITHKKVIVLSYVHEWKIINTFVNKNGYYYVSLTPRNCKTKSDEDDLIVMMLAGHRKSKLHEDVKSINDSFIKSLNKNKSVNMRGDGKKHHQSMGKYFGIGIINKYSKEKIGIFSNRKANDVNHSEVNELEYDVKSMFSSLHESINKVIPNITQASFTLMNALVKAVKSRRQGEYLHSINVLKNEDASFDHGCLCGYICENAETKEYHQESDNSYTSIGVPFFSDDVRSQLGHYRFQFKWDMNHMDNALNVRLTQGTFVFYSGYCLYHRQNHYGGNETFLNISTYHNSKLFSHVKGCMKKE